MSNEKRALEIEFHTLCMYGVNNQGQGQICNKIILLGKIQDFRSITFGETNSVDEFKIELPFQIHKITACTFYAMSKPFKGSPHLP